MFSKTPLINFVYDHSPVVGWHLKDLTCMYATANILGSLSCHYGTSLFQYQIIVRTGVVLPQLQLFWNVYYAVKVLSCCFNTRSLFLKVPMSTISDQKKRTLEALQRQYTAAKAKKLQDEQLKSHKKNKVDAPKPKFDMLRKGKAPELTPRQTSAQPSSHKGLVLFAILFYAIMQAFVYLHFLSYCCCFSGVAFSGSNCQQKPSASSGEEINPVYAELSCSLRENLFQDGISKGGDSGKITKGAKKLKLEKGILLDNYVQRGPRLVDAQARSLLIHSKRSKHHMSLKQHKKCGSFDLDGAFHKYDLYKPMHEMWKAYIRELTKITPKKQLSENLLSADLHGALLIVAECKAASYQGVSGIMIRDTAETFGIISEDNRFRGTFPSLADAVLCTTCIRCILSCVTKWLLK
jgi:ribonuclease P protein subunit POP4